MGHTALAHGPLALPDAEEGTETQRRAAPASPSEEAEPSGRYHNVTVMTADGPRTFKLVTREWAERHPSSTDPSQLSPQLKRLLSRPRPALPMPFPTDKRAAGNGRGVIEALQVTRTLEAAGVACLVCHTAALSFYGARRVVNVRTASHVGASGELTKRYASL